MDSKIPVGAGKGQVAGTMVDAGSSQQGDQQVKSSALVGARGTRRGTRASSLVVDPSQWRDTSVSKMLCKEEVVSSVTSKKGPSESDFCENGSRAVRPVIPKKELKGPNCVYRGLSIVVAGFRLSFTTSADSSVERGLKVVPGTSGAKEGHQRKITPRPETMGWRGESSDTFPGSRSTSIQNGRPTRRRDRSEWSAEKSSPRGLIPEERTREKLVKLPDQASFRAGKYPVSCVTPVKMAAAAKSTNWSRYNKKRDVNIANPSVIRLGGGKKDQDEPALRRVIHKCRTDLTGALVKVKAGIVLWNAGEVNRTFDNYKTYTDAADMTSDKFEYAESLYDFYINVRSDKQADVDYDTGFLAYINDNRDECKTAVEEWTRITTDYADEQWRLETPPAQTHTVPQEVVNTENGDEEDRLSSAAEKKKYRDEAIYRPKQALSSEDGVAFFRIWRDQTKTYFKLSGHLEKEAEQQKCVLMTLLAKILSNVVTNLENMLKEL